MNSLKCLNRYLCTCYKECERVIVYLLLEDVLHPKVVYTAYNTIVYICLGPKGPSLLSSPNPRAEINFPIRLPKRKQTSSSLQATTKTKKSKTKTNKAAAGKSKGKAKRKKGSKAKSAMPPLEIVEINSSSSEEEDNAVAQRRVAKKMRQQRQKKVIDSSDDDSDFEFSD